MDRLNALVPNQTGLTVRIEEGNRNLIIPAHTHEESMLLFLSLVQGDPIEIAFLQQQSVNDFLMMNEHMNNVNVDETFCGICDTYQVLILEFESLLLATIV